MLTLRQSEIFALRFAQKLLSVANYVRVVLKRTVVVTVVVTDASITSAAVIIRVKWRVVVGFVVGFVVV